MSRRRVRLNPWETKPVKFELSRYDVSYWDVITQDWVVPEGEFGIIVGRHSMDETLTGTHVFADPDTSSPSPSQSPAPAADNANADADTDTDDEEEDEMS